mgnify:CR=1 FL=1
MALLDVHNLKVEFKTPSGTVKAVNNINFSLDRGQCLGIVGESGSGKSQTFLGILGLLATNGKASGSAIFDGMELIGASRNQLNAIRGQGIALIFQDSITGLTPHIRIGAQLSEMLMVHKGMPKQQANEEVLKTLEIVQISDPESRMRSYPHELSGGMRQRIMIAMSLLCKPALIVADEPTTALDVTVQASVLRALRKLKRHTDTALVMITHDLGVVAGIADDIAVMYAGRIIEYGPTRAIFANPQHPYTQGLIACIPNPLEDANEDEELQTISGRPPDLTDLPHGCAFAPRCAYAETACIEQRPTLKIGQDGVHVACLKAGKI